MTKENGKHAGITVRIETYERLLRRKKFPDETINTVINRILDGDISEQPR